MGKIIAVAIVGIIGAFFFAFFVACYCMTGQVNPLLTHAGYIHIRAVAFLIFFVECGFLTWALCVMVDDELNKDHPHT